MFRYYLGPCLRTMGRPASAVRRTPRSIQLAPRPLLPPRLYSQNHIKSDKNDFRDLDEVKVDQNGKKQAEESFDLEQMREMLNSTLGGKSLDDVLLAKMEENTGNGFFSALRAKIPMKYTPFGVILSGVLAMFRRIIKAGLPDIPKVKYTSEELDMIDVIRDPIDSSQVRALFDKFDLDHDGKLSEEEWNAFGRLLFRADIDMVIEEVRAQIVEKVDAKAPNLPELLSYFGAPQFAKLHLDRVDPGFSDIYLLIKEMAPKSITVLAKKAQPKDSNAWIADMRRSADKDHDGFVSYEEFASFLENESRIEAATLRILILSEVADNMAENNGNLVVRVTQENGSLTTTTAPLFGLTADEVRNLK